jgi:uncharacterized repeat protein (TIGR03806 family)
MKKTIVLTIFFALIFLFNQCSTSDGTVQMDIEAEPFEKLSQYNFFTGKLADLHPNEGVLEYDLNSPLFSDYAHKKRFVWMPKGFSAKYDAKNILDFPVGSVLIKHFYYENDEKDESAGRRIIETRLLIHRKKGWEAHSYAWNDKQTEAKLDIIGGVVAVDWKDVSGKAMHANYIIPNKNQCKGCHSYKQNLLPIGPKVRNLNKKFAYADGEKNQLDKWSEMGYLTGYDAGATHQKAAQWDNPLDSLHSRAMAYLDINCGHCHNPHGPGGTTGLNLVYGAPLDLNVGVNKPPVAAGRASGGLASSIVKGHPERSILHYRMVSDETGVMMPELGRTMVHEEGALLIEEWIKQMSLMDN